MQVSPNQNRPARRLISGRLARVNMRKHILIVLGIILVGPLSVDARAKMDNQVVAALRNIPSTGGRSVFERIRACKIRIQPDASWIEKNTRGIPNQQILPDDMLLQLVIDVPTLPGDNPVLYHDLTARWIIRKGKAIPTSGWADQLQNKNPPIGSTAWMNC